MSLFGNSWRPIMVRQILEVPGAEVLVVAVHEGLERLRSHEATSLRALPK
jgi:hypothetical protein